MAHSQTQNHKVLDTLDALATLRSEAVSLLRHYTILSTMHATLSGIYQKFTVQVCVGGRGTTYGKMCKIVEITDERYD